MAWRLTDTLNFNSSYLKINIEIYCIDRRNNEISIILQPKISTFAQIPANRRRQRKCLGGVSFDQPKEARKIKSKSEK